MLRHFDATMGDMPQGFCYRRMSLSVLATTVAAVMLGLVRHASFFCALCVVGACGRHASTVASSGLRRDPNTCTGFLKMWLLFFCSGGFDWLACWQFRVLIGWMPSKTLPRLVSNSGNAKKWQSNSTGKVCTKAMKAPSRVGTSCSNSGLWRVKAVHLSLPALFQLVLN